MTKMKRKLKINKLKPFERKALIKELAKRAVDLVHYDRGHWNAKAWIDNLSGRTIFSDYKITFSYTVETIGNDLIQIVSRARRKKKKRVKK